MKPWRTHAVRKVFEAGKWLSVEMRTVETPSGQIIEDWPWVMTPDYINIVALTPQGRFICFRQDKYAFEALALALVGGYVEPGEAPLEAAQRELLEETGCTAEKWLTLGSYLVDPNRGVAVGHLFLALEARQITERDADDLEEQEIVYLMRSEVEAALDRGDFQVQAWTLCVALALRILDSLPSLRRT